MHGVINVGLAYDCFLHCEQYPLSHAFQLVYIFRLFVPVNIHMSTICSSEPGFLKIMHSRYCTTNYFSVFTCFVNNIHEGHIFTKKIFLLHLKLPSIENIKTLEDLCLEALHFRRLYVFLLKRQARTDVERYHQTV